MVSFSPAKQLDTETFDAEISDEIAANRPDARSNANSDNSQGQLIVISGPSGVGKGTLIKRLRQQRPDLQLSVSATTRQPRSNEVDGEHYYFVSKEQFQKMVERGDLLEWAEFAGNCYGTPKAPIEIAIAQGKRVILEIELLGARQVRENFPAAKQIFIAPPDEKALEERIRSRGQETEAAIAKRLQQAKVELAAAHEFDVKIVNDSLENALSEIETAIDGTTTTRTITTKTTTTERTTDIV
ncbi:MAG: guanylate kinase [Cyanobacteria bacterium J06621_11]